MLLPEVNAYEGDRPTQEALAELPSVDPDDDRFAAKMTVLSELVLHHAEEEEEELFPLCEKKLGRERLQQLGEQMQEMAESDQRRAA